MSALKELHTFHRNIYNSGYVTNKNNGKTTRIDVNKSKNIDEDGIVSFEKTSVQMISGSVHMSHEALIPLFMLSGHEVRLLLFILAYCANKESNKFNWNHSVADDYIELFYITTGKKVKPESVRQALVKLNKHNIINKISKGNYILNPLYSACGNIYDQSKLFNSFLEMEMTQKKAVDLTKSVLPKKS
jgi:hypothetical protein